MLKTKIGKVFKIILIVDDRFVTKNLESELALKRIRLKRKLKNTGLRIIDKTNPRNVFFNKIEVGKQVRQEFYLETTKELTKNDIYKVINSIEPQPLKLC